jgi:hypothetical protein
MVKARRHLICADGALEPSVGLLRCAGHDGR